MVEELVKKHGEEYRRIIVGALSFYEARKEQWETRVNREEYIDILIENTVKSNTKNK